MARTKTPDVLSEALDAALGSQLVLEANDICMILDDRETGMKKAGADPRRVAYAIGW